MWLTEMSVAFAEDLIYSKAAVQPLDAFEQNAMLRGPQRGMS